MWKWLGLCLVPAVVLFSGCSTGGGRPSGSDLEIHWGVLTNLNDGLCKSRLDLVNQSSSPLPGSDWTLYFNFERSILPDSVSKAFSIERINGDFYRLRPSDRFVGLGPGATATLTFESSGSIINVSGAPSGFYIIYGDSGTPQTIDKMQIEPFVSREQTDRGSDDHLPRVTAAVRYRRNEALPLLEGDAIPPLIPTPTSFNRTEGEVTVDIRTPIYYQPGLDFEAGYLSQDLRQVLGSAPDLVADPLAAAAPGRISLRVDTDSDRPLESYELTIDPETGISVTGGGPAGVFYGIQSLRALLPLAVYSKPASSIPLPAVTVDDAPRFPYRGLHLDVARNFHDKASIEKLLEVMSFYKLNRFHLHLSDDEGWRLEIPGLPELTDVGGHRGHTLDERDHLFPSFGSGPNPAVSASSGSGFLSRSDFIEILHYANRRHILVIPEIDVPGHARAAIKSMQARRARLEAMGDHDAAIEYALDDPEDQSVYRSVQGWDDDVINVCQDSTYRFLDKVVAEVLAMYVEAGVPLEVFHIGGDEVPDGVWEKSPICSEMTTSQGISGRQQLAGYFLNRMQEILAGHGLTLAGWEEVALVSRGDGRAEMPNPAFVARGFRPYAWSAIWGEGGEQTAYRLANAGYKVVLCNASNFYLDLAYQKDPQEVGADWAGFVDTEAAWRLPPLDLYLAATHDLMGNPLSPDDYRNAVRLTAAGIGNVLGIQGELWSENQKTDAIMEYMALPKMIGLAERAWAQPSDWTTEQDPDKRDVLQAAEWARFANAVGQHELPRLDDLQGGYAYRIPPPGAIIEDGQLKANVAFPGMKIRYTLDGSEPDAGSTEYVGPVRVTGPVKLRTFDTRGRGSRTVEPTASTAVEAK
ncbi:MAG: family 20 glycosylhydrolase [Acidobacteriota bacterium]